MKNIEEYMLPCLNKKLFGLDCMGCGMQRSIVLIFKGEFIQAFNMYPAIYTLLLLFIVISYNFFYNFKQSSRIILILSIINGLIIVFNFIFKTFFN